jgi:hypothetical protein
MNDDDRCEWAVLTSLGMAYDKSSFSIQFLSMLRMDHDFRQPPLQFRFGRNSKNHRSA